MGNNVIVTFALATKTERANSGSPMRTYRQPFLISAVQTDPSLAPVTSEPTFLPSLYFEGEFYGGLAADPSDVQLYRHVVPYGGATTGVETFLRWLDDYHVGFSHKLEFQYRRWLICMVNGDPNALL